MNETIEATLEAIDNIRRESKGSVRIGVLWSPLHAYQVERATRDDKAVERLIGRNVFGRMLTFAGRPIKVRERFNGEPVRAANLSAGAKLASEIAYSSRGFRDSAERICVDPDDHATLLDYLDFVIDDGPRESSFAFRRCDEGGATWFECFGLPIVSRDVATPHTPALG